LHEHSAMPAVAPADPGAAEGRDIIVVALKLCRAEDLSSRLAASRPRRERMLMTKQGSVFENYFPPTKLLIGF
jgi:hypothetical protein